MAEITNWETHKKHWVRSFHTAELAAKEYDRWQVRLHDAMARLYFPWRMVPVRRPAAIRGGEYGGGRGEPGGEGVHHGGGCL